MTELVFRGKHFVYNHHLAVPYHPLKVDAGKGIGVPRMDGNLVIHGDNLLALKALLPLYAGKVDCIFIDPPYNTGNEGWCYNDRVRSPVIEEWLAANPVGVDDGLRHDKWLCMMWPRLQLLHELLAEDGTIWITLDDNEIHHARSILDWIFGEEQFISMIAVQSNKRGHTFKQIAKTHEYILAYGKSPSCVLQELETNGDNLDQKDRFGGFSERELRNTNPKFGRHNRPNLFYPFYVRDGHVDEEGFHIASVDPFDGAEEIFPLNRDGRESCWRWGKERSREKTTGGCAEYVFAKKTRSGAWHICEKYRKESVKAKTIWSDTKHISEQGTRELGKLGLGDSFDFPKPLGVLEDIIRIATESDALILDSFAGSGTTGHAVLEANKRDGGTRRFILVECEEYADRVTAERIRRVINGYAFSGEQKTELLRERLTWKKLQNADKLTEAVERMESAHGGDYERIQKTIKDGELVVTGVKQVKERAEGLGGDFTYCTLDEPLEIDKILTGKHLPPYESMGAVLFRMATQQVFRQKDMRKAKFYLGADEGRHIWMRYKPDLEWLKSPKAALTLDWAREIAKAHPKEKHLVFAPSCYVSMELLNAERLAVEFVPFPYALYRIERG